MFEGEGPGGILLIGLVGAAGGALANGISSMIVRSTWAHTLRHSAMVSWIPKVVGHGVGTAVGSTVASGALDVTNIVNPSRDDYVKGFMWGLAFGGLAGGANYIWHTPLAAPVGVFSEGGYFFMTTPLPNTEQK